MKKKSMSERLKNYWGIEVAIEYKACLYFFCILFFYCCYLVAHKVYAASILHMAEMILGTYAMGYLQVYLLGNFDEAERFGKKEALKTGFCTLLYAAASYWFGWFQKEMGITILFCGYLYFAYICALIVNKIRRSVETEQLNHMLEAYKEEGEEHGE